MNILSIGNSFSADTTWHLPKIVADLGKEAYIANLYIGGCPIGYHYLNAIDDVPVYNYYTWEADKWHIREKTRISEAIRSRKWDWINIQHGSKDGRCYTQPVFYKHLGDLIAWVRAEVGQDVKISFNMAWAPEPEKEHHEMVALFGNDQRKMYEAMTALTRDLVATTPGIDRISPAGTAIQNARALLTESLNRDHFHLSYGLGRYIAALTFLKALTGWDISRVNWTPETMDASLRQTAIRCAEAAVRNPYDVSVDK